MSFKECPPKLKVCVPYLQRAHELASREPIVAYYCKSYAAQLGVANHEKGDAEASRFLCTLMDQLEHEKSTVANVTRDEAKDLVNTYALQLFKKADDKERAGIGDKVTLQLFYVSNVLMEVTKQFGEMDPDISEKQKYAKYKAALIKKYLDQGLPYVRPEEEEEGNNAANGGTVTDRSQPQQPYAPPPPSNYFPPNPYPNPNVPSYESQYQPMPIGFDPNRQNNNIPPQLLPYQQPQHITPAPVKTPQPPVDPAAALAAMYAPSNEATFKNISEAQKYAKWAVSALQFSDIPAAVQNLKKSLDLLEGRAIIPK